MVISLKSFLEDFVTITWIVHAVQRRARKSKKSKTYPSRIDHRITHTGRRCVCVCVCVWRKDRRWMSSPHAAGEPIKTSLREQRSEVGQPLFDWQVSAGGLLAGRGRGEGGSGGRGLRPYRLGVPPLFVDWALLSDIHHHVTHTDMHLDSKINTSNQHAHTWAGQLWFIKGITMDTNTQKSS